jgi:hypothetical protein
MTTYTRLEAAEMEKQLQQQLSVAQQRLDMALDEQLKFAHAYLHNDTCYGRDQLIAGTNCCDSNLWVSKSRKIAECMIYAYRQIRDAPHHKDCPRFKLGNILRGMTLSPATPECNCWKKKAMATMVTYFKIIGEK